MLMMGIIALLIVMFLFTIITKNETVFNDKEPVKVGLVGPWTGSSGKNGISMREGAEIAVENINSNGGIDGREVLLIEYDDKGQPQECIRAVNRLIFQDEVVAIIGPFNSANCLAVMDLINENKVPLITPIAMADEINKENDFVFRNTLGIKEANKKTNDFVNTHKGEYLVLEGMGCETMGMMWENDVWGQKMADTVIETLDMLGKSDQLIFSEPFELGQANYQEVFEKHKYESPDVIYVIALADEAITIVREGREQGYKGLFYGEGGFNSIDFDQQLGKLADGSLFCTQWHPSFSTPMSDIFIKKYTTKYKEKVPDMFAAITYEAFYILKNALENCNRSIDTLPLYREELRNLIAHTRNFNGVSGKISFDEVGQCDRPEFLLQKRWDGRKINSFIIYPEEYSQGQVNWSFELSEQ